MAGKDLSLLLCSWNGIPQHRVDLARIAKRVEETAPHIEARAVSHHRVAQILLLPYWRRPTFSLAMVQMASRKLLPGRFMTGRSLGKPGEYARMQQAGIPVPEWTEITPATRLDPAHWGPYVVEKPAAGRRGANVRIRRTSRVAYVAPEDWPEGHHGRNSPMLAQRFVYTGEWPTSYRVVTLFGEVLLCYRQVTAGRGAPLRSRWDFKGGGTSIVSNTGEMRVELVADPDVLALAESAHRRAFGDLALLAFDIVRDAETNEVFVLESHPTGWGWAFGTSTGLGIQAANGIVFEKQFDAFEKAPRILADMTPKLALRRTPFGAEDAPVWWSDAPPLVGVPV